MRAGIELGGVRCLSGVACRLDRPRLVRVLAYIDARIHERITVSDLAKVACLSTFHFSRAFSGATGIPPHRFVAQRRLEFAKQLIAAGDCSLIEVAFRCRFSSQASFTRAFRREMGVTPAEYRQQTLLNHDNNKTDGAGFTRLCHLPAALTCQWASRPGRGDVQCLQTLLSDSAGAVNTTADSGKTLAVAAGKETRTASG